MKENSNRTVRLSGLTPTERAVILSNPAGLFRQVRISQEQAKTLQIRITEQKAEIETWVKIVEDARAQILEARTAADFLAKRLSEELEINRKGQ